LGEGRVRANASELTLTSFLSQRERRKTN